jgi:hypothetical protein
MDKRIKNKGEADRTIERTNVERTVKRKMMKIGKEWNEREGHIYCDRIVDKDPGESRPFPASISPIMPHIASFGRAQICHARISLLGGIHLGHLSCVPRFIHSLGPLHSSKGSSVHCLHLYPAMFLDFDPGVTPSYYKHAYHSPSFIVPSQ